MRAPDSIWGLGPRSTGTIQRVPIIHGPVFGYAQYLLFARMHTRAHSCIFWEFTVPSQASAAGPHPALVFSAIAGAFGLVSLVSGFWRSGWSQQPRRSEQVQGMDLEAQDAEPALPPVVQASIGAAASAAVLLGTPAPAPAITEQQLLFLEAWRAVDRAYVDKTFNGQNWLKYQKSVLKSPPLTDSLSSSEETYDVIRTMLATLGDPFTRFVEPKALDAIRCVSSRRRIQSCHDSEVEIINPPL